MTLTTSAFDVQPLRTNRRDCFIAGLLAPESVRPILWALASLDYEWGRTRHLVSDPGLGQIRLLWWQDALNQTAQGLRPPHPALAVLAPALTAQPGLLPLLTQLLEGHISQLESCTYPDLASWYKAASLCTRPFVTLWATLCGPAQVDIYDALLDDIARIRGAALMLHDLPVAFETRDCPLPQDMIAQHQTSAARLIDFPNDPAIAPIILACAKDIGCALPATMYALRRAPLPIRCAGLLMHAVRGPLAAIHKAKGHPFRAPHLWYRPDGLLALRLLWARHVG